MILNEPWPVAAPEPIPPPGSPRWLEAGGHDAREPFVAMGFAAAHTTTLRLIPNIVVPRYRNPFLVAKAGATLDLLSGGRFTLAMAAGYLKSEFAALGVTRVQVGLPGDSVAHAVETIQRYGEQVIARA